MHNLIASTGQFLRFILTLMLLFYLPGHFIFKRLRIKLLTLDWIVLSFSLGILVSVQGYYLAGMLRKENIFLWTVVFLSFFYSIVLLFKYFRNRNKPPKINFSMCRHPGAILSRRHKTVPPKAGRMEAGRDSAQQGTPEAFSPGGAPLTLMVMMIIAVSYLTIMTSATLYPDGMRFYDANAFDSMGQLAFSVELMKPFPHQTPFWAGTDFKGYHIDAYYPMALVSKVSGIDPLIVFFKLRPLFIFPLLVLLIFVSIRRLYNAKVAIVSVFFTLFMADLSWIFPILDRAFASYTIDTVYLMGNIILSLFFNPPFLQAVIIFFSGLYFLKVSEEEKRFSPILLCAAFFGLLFKYKSFYGTVAISAFMFLALLSLLQGKDRFLLKIALLSVPFFVFSLFSTTQPHAAGIFRLTPGYYILVTIENLESSFHANFPRNIFVFIFGFLFFLVGSLGVKVFGFWPLLKEIRNWKKLAPSKTFLILCALLGFGGMYLFTLKTNYPNATFSFYTIFLIVMSLYFSQRFVDFLDKKNTRFKFLALSFIVVLGLGSTLFAFLGYLPQYVKYKRLDRNELKVIDFIKKNTSRDAVILHNRKQLPWYLLSTGEALEEINPGRDSFISALTQRRTVAECAWHMETGRFSQDLLKRQNDVELFFKTKNRAEASNILKDYKVSHVWLQANQKINFDPQGLLKEVFSADDIRIYEVVEENKK